MADIELNDIEQTIEHTTEKTKKDDVKLKIRVGTGNTDYDHSPYLTGKISKGSFDAAVDEVAKQVIEYIKTNTSVPTGYIGERNEDNIIEYTPRGLDRTRGYIEDVINVNNEDKKITSNYQYKKVLKKYEPIEIEEDVDIHTIFEMYVDDKLVVDITNAWLLDKPTDDPKYVNTPYTVSGPYEDKSTLLTTGEEQVQYRYYIITVSLKDAPIINNVKKSINIYYIFDNENSTNANYEIYNTYYLIENNATVLPANYIESLNSPWIRTVHFDGVKSTFKFTSEHPSINVNAETVTYDGGIECTKYPVGSTNGEDFGVIAQKTILDKTFFDESVITHNSLDGIKNFIKNNLVTIPETIDNNIITFDYKQNIKPSENNGASIKVIKTKDNTFYLEQPNLLNKAPVYNLYIYDRYYYAIIPNINKIENSNIIDIRYFYPYIHSYRSFGQDFISQEFAYKHYGDYQESSNTRYRSDIKISYSNVAQILSGSQNGYTVKPDNFFSIKQDNFFGKHYLTKIYYNNEYIGTTVLNRYYSVYNGNTLILLGYTDIRKNGTESHRFISDYITVNGKKYLPDSEDINNRSSYYFSLKDINYDDFINNIESYTVCEYYTGKEYLKQSTNYKSLYVDVEYINNKNTNSIVTTKQTLLASVNIDNPVISNNSIVLILHNVDVTDVVVDNIENKELIKYISKNGDYIVFTVNGPLYVNSDYHWEDINSLNKPKIKVYFNSIEYYYKINTYIDDVLTSEGDIVNSESSTLVYSIPFITNKTLLQVNSPADYSINYQDGKYSFDISAGTADNPVVISLYYKSVSFENIWPVVEINNYSYGWVANNEIVENQLHVSPGVEFALKGWPTDEGVTSENSYDEDSPSIMQTWYNGYWALKSNVTKYSIGTNGEKIAGFKTKFSFNMSTGESKQIIFYNVNDEVIAKSPIIMC